MNIFHKKKSSNDKIDHELDPTDLDYSKKLSIYLNSEGSLDKLFKEAEKKLNKEETLKIEKILLKLIKEVNPQTKVYKSKANKLLVIKILKYLSEKKTNKQSVDPIEVFYLLKEYYSKDPLYQYLFEKESNLTNNEVFYLEIIIPFLYDKNISLIINMLKNYLKEEDINFIREEITEINLRSYKGFIFLRKIILCVINSNGNLKQNFQDMKKNYMDNEKNEFLRCNKCFNFPMLFLDANKKISIKYSCEHLGEKEILKPEMIQNIKPKCFNCEKYLFETYKNFLCSNCKNIFCKDCLQIHFKKCLSLFYIPLSEVGLICSDHNSPYVTFCSICKMNLCARCKEEHFHYSNKPENSLAILIIKDVIKDIKKYIESDDIIDNCYKELIKAIISDNKYLNNFQFICFFFDLLGKKSIFDCGLFEEFGNDKFNKYYSVLISKYKKGNEYYIKIFNQIKDVYEKNNKIINKIEMDISSSFIRTKDDMKILSRNSFKTSLLTNYFISLNEVKNKINEEKNKSNEDIIKIRKEKSQILVNSLLFQNNNYRAQAFQLLDRTIADSFIRYLIVNYAKSFEKIDCNLGIYNDILENFSRSNILVKNFEKNKKDEINNLLENKKIKLNDSQQNGENNSNNETNIDNVEGLNNSIHFKNPITINKNTEIPVIDLNFVLEYLFYLKSEGNYIAHPNNDKNSTLSITPKNLNEEKSNETSNIDIPKFNQDLLKIFQKNIFKVNISNELLINFLFDKNYEKLLSKIETTEIKEIEDIIKQGKNLDVSDKIQEEFKKLDNSIKAFKDLEESLQKYSIKKKANSLNEFYERLYKSFNNQESAWKILTNLMEFDYENSLLDNMPIFISDCLDHIISKLYKKNEGIIKEFDNEIKRLKIKRGDNMVILELFKKLKEKTENLEEEEKENMKDSVSKGFIDFLNKDKNENEKKIEYSEGNELLDCVRKNLGKLLKKQINWTKYNRIKILSLLCLYQNQS